MYMNCEFMRPEHNSSTDHFVCTIVALFWMNQWTTWLTSEYTAYYMANWIISDCMMHAYCFIIKKYPAQFLKLQEELW